MFNILSEAVNQSCWKKDSTEVYEYIQISLYEFTLASEQSKENDVFQCGFLRTLVTCQKYMQNIPENLRETD